jgi:hypothetical protein
MSHAYLSSALPDMVCSTEEKLRQERANLWRAKYLNRQLTGDASWIPAGEVELPDDWELFEPRTHAAQRPPSRKRKRQVYEEVEPSGKADPSDPTRDEPKAMISHDGDICDETQPTQANGESAGKEQETNKFSIERLATNGEAKGDKQVGYGRPIDDTRLADASPGEPAAEEDIAGRSKSELNGFRPDVQEQNGINKRDENGETDKGEAADVEPDIKPQSDEQASRQASRTASDLGGASPPPPTRRITRALAANNNSNAPTPPLSPALSSTTTSSSSQLQIDPLYLVPPSANPSNQAITFHGLLPEEALETRRLLTLYIQKQEESVRGYESILSKLLTAQRLRTEVLEMCKTEEHVGELSDGEDWIDAERWGLQPGELRKGRDEDDDVMEENTIGGRKGKRRARN